MGFKKVLIEISTVILLIGGVLYLTLGFLALSNNKKVYEKLVNIKEKKKESQTIEDIIEKEKLYLVLELFIASSIDFILMFICIYKTNLINPEYKESERIALLDDKKEENLENESLKSSENLYRATIN